MERFNQFTQYILYAINICLLAISCVRSQMFKLDYIGMPLVAYCLLAGCATISLALVFLGGVYLNKKRS